MNNNNNTLLKIKVHRSLISSFPFDIFYLVHYDQRAILPKLFPWSLCIPIGEPLLHLLQSLGSRRCDDIETIPYRGDKQSRVRPDPAYPFQINLPKDLEHHFVLVPVHPRRMLNYHMMKYHTQRDGETWYKGGKEKALKDYKHHALGYITAQRHVKENRWSTMSSPILTNGNKYEHLFDEQTILFTPDGPSCPPCIKCPRHLLHMQGKCRFGGKVCLDSLVLKQDKDEDKDEDKEEKGEENEQLSKNDSDSDTATSGSSDTP